VARLVHQPPDDVLRAWTQRRGRSITTAEFSELAAEVPGRQRAALSFSR
jgi:hypothetical protein